MYDGLFVSRFLIVVKGVCWRRGVSYCMTGCFFRGVCSCVRWQAVCFAAVYCMAGCFSEAKGWMVGLPVLGCRLTKPAVRMICSSKLELRGWSTAVYHFSLLAVCTYAHVVHTHSVHTYQVLDIYTSVRVHTYTLKGIRIYTRGLHTYQVYKKHIPLINIHIIVQHVALLQHITLRRTEAH